MSRAVVDIPNHEGVADLTAPEITEVIYQASGERGVFVNRTEEIAIMARINTQQYLRFQVDRSKETKALCVPVSLHTFGAGKTALAEAYRSRLLSPDSKVSEMLDQFSTTEREAAERAIRQMAEDGVDLLVIAENTVEETFGEILSQIIEKDLVSEELVRLYDFSNHSKLTLLKRFISSVRSRFPIFLTVDEIGKLTYEEFQELRNSLAELHIRTAKDGAFPLHMYFCGRVGYKDQILAGGQGGSQHELVVLRALLPEHVRQIRTKLKIRVAHKSAADPGSVETAFDMEVARLTAGIGRHIRRLLAVVALRGYSYQSALEAIKGAKAVALKMAMTPPLVQDYERLDTKAAVELAGMAAAQCLGTVFPEHSLALNCCRYLPVMRQSCEGGVTVMCAPLFTWGLADLLDQVSLNIITEGSYAAFSTEGLNRAEAREMHVIHALQRRLIKPLLLHQLQGGYPTDVITVKLKTLLDFLPDAIPDQDVSIKFEHELLQQKFTKDSTLEEKFAAVNSHPQCISRPFDRSKSADVFLHPGPVGQDEFAVVEFQVKQGEQEISWKEVSLDCIKKGSKPGAGGKVLHILLADTLHQEVLKVFPTGQSVLVLEPGHHFSFLLRKNLGGGKKRRIVEVNEQVPEFLTILLVKPTEFQQFAPEV